MKLVSSGLPWASLTPLVPPVMKPLNFLLAARGFSVVPISVAPKGSSVAVWLLLLRVIVAGIVFHFFVFLLNIWSLKVEEVWSGFSSETAAIGSEKVALKPVVRETVAFLTWLKLFSRTVGLVVSSVMVTELVYTSLTPSSLSLIFPPTVT